MASTLRCQARVARNQPASSYESQGQFVVLIVRPLYPSMSAVCGKLWSALQNVLWRVRFPESLQLREDCRRSYRFHSAPPSANGSLFFDRCLKQPLLLVLKCVTFRSGGVRYRQHRSQNLRCIQALGLHSLMIKIFIITS